MAQWKSAICSTSDSENVTIFNDGRCINIPSSSIEKSFIDCYINKCITSEIYSLTLKFDTWTKLNGWFNGRIMLMPTTCDTEVCPLVVIDNYIYVDRLNQVNFVGLVECDRKIIADMDLEYESKEDCVIDWDLAESLIITIICDLTQGRIMQYVNGNLYITVKMTYHDQCTFDHEIVPMLRLNRMNSISCEIAKGVMNLLD